MSAEYQNKETLLHHLQEPAALRSLQSIFPAAPIPLEKLPASEWKRFCRMTACGFSTEHVRAVVVFLAEHGILNFDGTLVSRPVAKGD